MVERIRETGSVRNQALGILVDLAGPKIRLGQLASDPLICPQGSLFRIVRGDVAQQQDELVSNYPQLIDLIQGGLDKVDVVDFEQLYESSPM